MQTRTPTCKGYLTPAGPAFRVDYLRRRYHNYRMAINVRLKSPLFLWCVLLVSVCVLVFYVGDSLTVQGHRYVASIGLRNFFGQTFASPPFPIPIRNITNSSDGSLFIFSAFERCPAAKHKTLLLNTWLRIQWPPRKGPQKATKAGSGSPIFCCFLLPNRTTMMTSVTWSLGLYGKTSLPVRRLQCAVPVTGSYAVTVMNVPVVTGLSENNGIENGTVTTNSTTTNSTINKPAPNKLSPVACPSSLDHYILPTMPLIPETYTDLNEAESTKIDQNCLIKKERNIRADQNETFSFAICAKLAFGNLCSHLLIEWIEYNLKMGVSKIIVYTYNLNFQAARVLRHYEKEGKVVMLPFDIPSPKNPERSLGEKNHQAYNDEQVALYDCYERLRLYKHVAVVDFDEFIVPTLDQNFNELMTRIQKAAPSASKFIFKMVYHITDWAGNVTKGPDTILALAYRDHTGPIGANVKLVTLPGRTHFGATWTHAVPRMLTPYTSYNVPDSIAAINHYRRCRLIWKKSCFRQKRTNTSEIFRLLDEPLRNAILQKKKLLLF